MRKRVKLDTRFSDFELPASAINMDRYHRNPVVLMAHDHNEVIGKCIRADLSGDEWILEIETVDARYLQFPFAPGIIIKKFHYDEDGNKVIDECDLVEISAILTGEEQ